MSGVWTCVGAHVLRRLGAGGSKTHDLGWPLTKVRCLDYPRKHTPNSSPAWRVFQRRNLDPHPNTNHAWNKEEKLT